MQRVSLGYPPFVHSRTFVYSFNDGKHSTTHCQVVTVVPCVLICLPPEPLPSPSGVSTDPLEYQETPEAHVSAPSFSCVQRSSTRLHLIAPVVPTVDHIFSVSPLLFPFSSSFHFSSIFFPLVQPHFFVLLRKITIIQTIEKASIFVLCLYKRISQLIYAHCNRNTLYIIYLSAQVLYAVVAFIQLVQFR